MRFGKICFSNNGHFDKLFSAVDLGASFGDGDGVVPSGGDVDGVDPSGGDVDGVDDSSGGGDVEVLDVSSED